VAIGTETDGSIVSPASNNSLVGIKPTLGLVSRAGIVPVSLAQDTAGPMARTVADAAALLHGPALAALGAMMQVFADAAIWLIVFGWLPLLALAIVAFATTRMRRPTAPPAPTA